MPVCARRLNLFCQGIFTMFRKSTSSIHPIADAASESLEHAVQATQRVADQTLDKVSSTAQDLRQRVSPLLERAGEQASTLARRGVHTVRDQAQRASDSTVGYIRDEPVKAVLIAAAAGAMAVALLRWLRRPA